MSGAISILPTHYNSAYSANIYLLLIFLIIIPTYAQISSVKLVLKVLRHVSAFLHDLQEAVLATVKSH
jgi:hypothetical protein